MTMHEMSVNIELPSAKMSIHAWSLPVREQAVTMRERAFWHARRPVRAPRVTARARTEGHSLLTPHWPSRTGSEI